MKSKESRNYCYFERKCDWELKIDAQLKEVDDKFQLFSAEDPRLIEITIIQKTGFTNPSKQIESCEQLLDYSLNKEKAKKLHLRLLENGLLLFRCLKNSKLLICHVKLQGQIEGISLFHVIP